MGRFMILGYGIRVNASGPGCRGGYAPGQNAPIGPDVPIHVNIERWYGRPGAIRGKGKDKAVGDGMWRPGC
eukprot:scaffold1916_cov394-Pavlova_lutheri.AAC.4